MTKKKESELMKELLIKDKQAPHLPQSGDLVEGQIIKISKNALILDLGPSGTGIVYGGELREDKDMLKELAVGQNVSALVLDLENEDGYVELSLREANLEKAWLTLREKKQTDQTVTVKVTEANRGGLIIKTGSLIGFLPVSQLSNENYPRVEGGDKDKILDHLNKFVGQEMKVKIIDLDQRTDKLIVSEKAVRPATTAPEKEVV
ncbi:MAG: S1 RNA-binding domain-containing protein [Candidatus Portnoybacteria bacterium]|nr:S1 RNA-binding domain-containing protein [Candidatus Portnoybacteria bacterium]